MSGCNEQASITALYLEQDRPSVLRLHPAPQKKKLLSPLFAEGAAEDDVLLHGGVEQP